MMEEKENREESTKGATNIQRLTGLLCFALDRWTTENKLDLDLYYRLKVSNPRAWKLQHPGM